MSSSDQRGVNMNPQSNSTGRVVSQEFRTSRGSINPDTHYSVTYGNESSNVGSLINEYGNDRDQNFEMYDNNFGNVNAQKYSTKATGISTKRGKQTASGLSYMKVEENTESTGPQFKNTLELIASIENMKELLDLSKGEMEYCLQHGTLVSRSYDRLILITLSVTLLLEKKHVSTILYDNMDNFIVVVVFIS